MQELEIIPRPEPALPLRPKEMTIVTVFRSCWTFPASRLPQIRQALAAKGIAVEVE